MAPFVADAQTSEHQIGTVFGLSEDIVPCRHFQITNKEMSLAILLGVSLFLNLKYKSAVLFCIYGYSKNVESVYL